MKTEFLTILPFLLLTACGSGGEDTGWPPPQSAIEIQMPTAEPTYATDCNEIWLSGNTDYAATEWKNSVISWKRQSSAGVTQGVGQATVGQCLGWFFGYTWYYDCNASWGANIPLDVGANIITITATKANAVIGQDTVTVNKPVMSYCAKGRVTNIDGAGLFNMKIIMEGATPFTFTNSDGSYEIPCLRSGTYTIRPDPIGFYAPANMFFNYMNWPLSPAARTVELHDADATGQDFSTEVYEISGRLTTVYGYGFANQDVLLTATDNSTASAKTDAAGYYLLWAPKGTYVISPPTYTSFNPDKIQVTVEGTAITNQDFSAK